MTNYGKMRNQQMTVLNIITNTKKVRYYEDLEEFMRDYLLEEYNANYDQIVKEFETN